MGAKKLIWTEDQQNVAIEMHASGKSVFEIAAALHKSPRGIYDALTLLGRVKPMPTNWPQEWDDELRRVCREMSTLKIADHLSKMFGFPITKNSVIGRMHRMGLHADRPRVVMSRESAAHARKAHKKPKRKKEPKLVIPKVDPIGGDGVPLVDMTFPIRQCRWPTGRGVKGMLCCGHPVKESKSYCEYHNSIAVMDENTRTRSRKADRLGGFRLQQLSVGT